MALVGATIANGGTCYYPRLIDRIVDRDGKDVIDPDTGKPAAAGPRVRTNLADLGLKPDQIEHIRHGMWRVVNDPGGTAPKAKLKNIEVAGKTGTAQFWRKGVSDNHTWFMSFAPYKDPKIAVVVFIQGAQGGGITAAPIAAHIIEETLALEDNKLQVPVKSLEPAVGNFTFIDNVDFSSGDAVVKTAASSDAAKAGKFTTVTRSFAADNDETPLADSETDHDATNSDHNVDPDKVATSAPRVREKSDKSESSSGRGPQVRPPTTPRCKNRCGNSSAATTPATVTTTTGTPNLNRKPYVNSKKLSNRNNSKSLPTSLRPRPRPSARSSWASSDRLHRVGSALPLVRDEPSREASHGKKSHAGTDARRWVSGRMANGGMGFRGWRAKGGQHRFHSAV